MLNELSILPYLVHHEGFQVAIYGGGSQGRICIKWLKQKGIAPVFVIDADEKKAGSHLEDIPIISVKQFIGKKNEHKKIYGVISTTFYNDEAEKKVIIRNLVEGGIREFCGLYDGLGFPEVKAKWYEYYLQHMQELDKVYNLLEDEESKETMLEYLKVTFECRKYNLRQHPTEDKYWGTEEPKNLYIHLKDEVLINCGSNTGDTIFKFLDKGYEFKKIVAIDGDMHMCMHMRNNLTNIDEKKMKKISIINQYIGKEDEKNRFDELFLDERVTLINMDIEGSELDVLKGAKQIISNEKPVLAICAYHKAEDLIDITNYILSCSAEYKFFLRKYCSCYGYFRNAFLQANELVLYAIPNERIMR